MQPNIPFGLASRLMALAAAVSAVIAAYHAIKAGDHSQETIVGFVTAVLSLMVLALGRYGQAIADRLNQHLAEGNPAGGSDAMLADQGILPEDLA